MDDLHLHGAGRYDLYDHSGNKEFFEKLDFIIDQNKKIMDTQKEAVAEVKKATEQLKKVGAESAKTLEKVTRLEEVIANLPNKIDPELADAITELTTQIKVVDDMVPDPSGEEMPA